jgi:hypothetical protein
MPLEEFLESSLVAASGSLEKPLRLVVIAAHDGSSPN